MTDQRGSASVSAVRNQRCRLILSSRYGLARAAECLFHLFTTQQRASFEEAGRCKTTESLETDLSALRLRSEA